MREGHSKNRIEIIGSWFINVESRTKWRKMISCNWVKQSVLGVDRIEIISEAVELFREVEVLIGIRSWWGDSKTISQLKFSDEKGRFNFR